MIIIATVIVLSIVNTEIITKTRQAKRESDRSNVKDGLLTEIASIKLDGRDPTNEEYENMLDKYGDVIYGEDNETSLGVEIEKGNDVYLYELIDDSRANGSWNGKINTPKLVSGLIPVYWDEQGNEKYGDVGANWYDYSQNKWANAVVKNSDGKITGYFVWIPRFEYNIDSANKIANINFVPISKVTATAGYKMHPAFMDGRSSNFSNGEWDKELAGFWVAKYQAGYQKNTITQNEDKTLSLTISNLKDTIVYSDKNYTAYRADYTTNPLEQKLTSTNYSKEKISYPVFLPLTYTYNLITTGDSYIVAKEISKASNFYGLNKFTDSHLIKNSEWGAVAYLSSSSYGRNGAEINMNNFYKEYEIPSRICITGIYGDGSSLGQTKILNNAYNTQIGVLGSSTGNITGVYDLNGGVWEHTAAYIANSHTSLRYGSSYTKNADGSYIITSTKYATVYPYNTSNDTAGGNQAYYSNYLSTRYGDAIIETNGWHGDYSAYSYDKNPFLERGGVYWDGSGSGLYAYYYSCGYMSPEYGFRICLAF